MANIIKIFKISLPIILFFPSILKANSDSTHKNPFFISVRTYYGFIIPHSESIRSISYSRPRGIGVDVGWLFLNKRAWDYCFCYPMLGFNFYYTDFNNRKILGHAFALLFYAEPSFNFSRKLYFSYRFGFGVSYMDTPYDSINNPKNLFYSTYLSFPLQASITLNWNFSTNLKTRLSIHYEHISNGGLKQPNKGINYPTFGIGVLYFVNNFVIPTRNKLYSELYPSKIQLNILFYATAKTISNNENKRYFIYGFDIEAQKRFARINSVSLGTEITIDNSLKEIIQRQNNDKDYKRAGILIGHKLLIGKIVFYQKIGIYYYCPYKAKDPVYQRYGITYKLMQNVLVGIDLKAHRHVADFLDIRMGYVFGIKK